MIQRACYATHNHCWWLCVVCFGLVCRQRRPYKNNDNNYKYHKRTWSFFSGKLKSSGSFERGRDRNPQQQLPIPLLYYYYYYYNNNNDNNKAKEWVHIFLWMPIYILAPRRFMCGLPGFLHLASSLLLSQVFSSLSLSRCVLDQQQIAQFYAFFSMFSFIHLSLLYLLFRAIFLLQI